MRFGDAALCLSSECTYSICVHDHIQSVMYVVSTTLHSKNAGLF